MKELIEVSHTHPIGSLIIGSIIVVSLALLLSAIQNIYYIKKNSR